MLIACPVPNVGLETVPTIAGQLDDQVSDTKVASPLVSAEMFELVVVPTLTQTLSAFL